MILDTIVVGPLMVNNYLLGCEKTRKGVIIDPGDDCKKILSAVSRHRLEILYVINTHGHFDHVGGNAAVLKATGAKLLIHELDASMLSRAANTAAMFGIQSENSPHPDALLCDGELLSFGDFELKILHTPGHSRGGCSLHGKGMVFCGDTLFADLIARTDLPGGSSREMSKSIREKLMTLPDDTIVYPGHGPSTTIGRERLNNPYIDSL
jgi:hydroxyacylglutathione hydrolase